jgi:S1-C subfamily serine protease
MSAYDRDFPGHYPRPRPSPPFPWVAAVLWGLVLGLAGFVVWLFWGGKAAGGGTDEGVPPAVVALGNLQQEQELTEGIYRKAAPSVVHVTLLGAARNRLTLNLERIPRGTGSGFVWDDQGHIVTNNHVVEGGTFGVSVTLADHSTWPARVTGTYPDKDLAVLQISAPKEKLRPLAVGTSADLQVGQNTYAIGNPFGLDQSLTTGIISALGREIESETKKRIKGVIQTDAPINPGNSGGPLLDSAGRLIGVNSAILSPSGTWAGVGFAIPVDEVNRVVTDIIRHPQPQKPALGVTVAQPEMQQQLGVRGGVLIWDVLPGGAAAKAGLRPTRRTEDGDVEVGDVLIAVGDAPVRSVEDVHRALARRSVGDRVPVTVLRDGQRQTIDVTLDAAP